MSGSPGGQPAGDRRQLVDQLVGHVGVDHGIAGHHADLSRAVEALGQRPCRERHFGVLPDDHAVVAREFEKGLLAVGHAVERDLLAAFGRAEEVDVVHVLALEPGRHERSRRPAQHAQGAFGRAELAQQWRDDSLADVDGAERGAARRADHQGVAGRERPQAHTAVAHGGVARRAEADHAVSLADEPDLPSRRGVPGVHQAGHEFQAGRRPGLDGAGEFPAGEAGRVALAAEDLHQFVHVRDDRLADRREEGEAPRERHTGPLRLGFAGGAQREVVLFVGGHGDTGGDGRLVCGGLLTAVEGALAAEGREGSVRRAAALGVWIHSLPSCSVPATSTR
nr:hypothetical protein [Streptomyces polyasparticus]